MEKKTTKSNARIAIILVRTNPFLSINPANWNAGERVWSIGIDKRYGVHVNVVIVFAVAKRSDYIKCDFG